MKILAQRIHTERKKREKKNEKKLLNVKCLLSETEKKKWLYNVNIGRGENNKAMEMRKKKNDLTKFVSV